MQDLSSDPQTTFCYIKDAYKICSCPDYQVAISENCLKTVVCVVKQDAGSLWGLHAAIRFEAHDGKERKCDMNYKQRISMKI